MHLDVCAFTEPQANADLGWGAMAAAILVKGGGLVFTWVLTPLLQAAPVAAVGVVAHQWRGRKKAGVRD